MSQLEVRDCDKHGPLSPFLCGQCAQDAMRARAEKAEGAMTALYEEVARLRAKLESAHLHIEILGGKRTTSAPNTEKT